MYVGGAGISGTLYAVSEADGSVRWSRSVENGDESSPALSATDVYVSYACGLVYDIDRAGGEQKWFSNGPCEGGGGGKTAVDHGGKIYARDRAPATRSSTRAPGRCSGPSRPPPRRRSREASGST